MSCRCRRATAGNAVRLLHERNGDADRPRGLGRRDEVGRADTAARPVTEDESASRFFDRVQMNACPTVRRLDLDRHGPESTLGLAPMLYLVIETYLAGAAAVYARAAERGRMLPAGLSYVESWVDAETLDRCYQLMETDEPELFDEWTSSWNDIVDFVVVPVICSAEAAERSQSGSDDLL